MQAKVSGLQAELENPGMFTLCSFFPKAKGLGFLLVSQDRSTVVRIEMAALIFLLF